MPNPASQPGFSELLGNEEAYMSCWCKDSDVHGVRFYRNPALPIHLFNFVTRLWQFPDGPELLKHVTNHYRAQDLPHRLSFVPCEAEQLAHFFVEHGYSVRSERLILAHDLTSIPQSSARGVNIEAIAGPADRQEWVRVALDSWTHPSFPDDFERIVLGIAADGVAAGEFTCYVVALEGQRVGTGLMNRTGNVAGIHAITTRPAARGRGVASALVAGIITDAAAEGFETVCLQTGKGDGADRLCQRMGFQILYTLPKYGPRT